MSIGDRIKSRRIELNMSQDELAKKLGYKSRSSINKIEKDGRNLPQDKIKALANILHTTPGYIMGWTDEKNKLLNELTKQYGELSLELLILFDKLNNEGQNKIIDNIKDLIEIPKYKK